MTRARRAKPRPSRILIPVAAVLAAGAAVAGWQLNNADPTARPSVLPMQSKSAAPSPPVASSSAKPTPSASSTLTASAAALRDCQTRVRAGDAVLAAARTGVGHWAEHVQAQTDANVDKITVPQMTAIFKRTRLAGPKDQQRYSDAAATYRRAEGSCAPVEGAATPVADALQRCERRDEAQQPLLLAAADGMADWRDHLADMRRAQRGQVQDPQGVWLRTWGAAPPHIKAYERAAKDFSAPRC